ncbi:MAG: hypothetical protein IT581_17455 [Verrucomicrobiales bacterium]|nr:hypothetical protein [Verrucomicrobiales bacterium]
MKAALSARFSISILIGLSTTLPPVSAAAADPLATWHVRTPPTSPTQEDFNGIAYGAGRWVVVGGDGSILTSTDGVTWEPQFNPAAPRGLQDVGYANGQFVAIGSRADDLLTSPDGVVWTRGSLGLSGGRKVIHDGTRFIVLASGGFLGISTNAINWDSQYRVPMKFVDAGGIAFGNGAYVEVGYMRTGQPTDLYSSSNLTQWTFHDAQVNENLMDVTFGLGLFVAVGQDGAITTSPDGAEWTPRKVDHTGFIWDLACDGQHLVAAAQWGRLLVSDNGIDWTRHDTGLPWHLTDVAYGNGTFIAVGWNGQIVQSDPVLTFPVPIPIGTRLSNPSWTDDRFSFQFTAIAGRSYEIQTSTDGRVWTQAATIVAPDSKPQIVDPAADGRHRFYRIVKLN